MATNENEVGRLKAKYGAAVAEKAAELVDPRDMAEALGWADDLDPHYMKLLLEFTYGGMYRRGVLDDRTRTLVVVAQFVILDEMEQLAQHIRTAKRV